jgi:hypothetical protein
MEHLPSLTFLSQCRLKLTFLIGFLVSQLAQARVRTYQLTLLSSFKGRYFSLESLDAVTDPNLTVDLLANNDLLDVTPRLPLGNLSFQRFKPLFDQLNPASGAAA